MSDTKKSKKEKVIETGVKNMHLENGTADRRPGKLRSGEVKQDPDEDSKPSPRDAKMESASQSPVKQEFSHSSGESSEEHEEVIGGGVTLKMDPGEPPKLARSTSQKIVAGPAKLFNDHPAKTDEARETFQNLAECVYSSKYIGSTEHDSMECDCAEEWDGIAGVNAACGDDSDCINRATKMECVGDCGCGADCQNQRFQRQQFADVSVFKTEKKGYGLRADTDLKSNEFIYEYIGEVINESQFRKRMLQYDDEGIKHFYFMSLNKGEFVDATKRGNLGRFCNHSCNPNCYVDKWVVGEKLRMGIFAERKIKAGEELVFNYNVDRYGADPQPCYCGEPNCTGFIGGKTQTERATKLSNLTIEALGIDDGDGWDTAVARKPRKKKVGEDDEEYVNNVQPKSLDENGVTKVMATLMQCKEKWIAVKLLSRIQRCDDERVRNRVVKMHGYQILNSTLVLWKEDANVVLQVFDVLDKFPRLTRNKISDSKIEATVEGLKDCSDERVVAQAAHLLTEWSTLEVAYRIPRKKREAVADAPEKTNANKYGRRDSSRDERKPRSISPKSSKSRSRSRSIDAPRGPAALNGPRSTYSQRPNFYSGPRPPFRPRPFNALPSGWFVATDQNGRQYYYDHSGKTTWERPTQPAAPPPPPPKPTSTNKALEDIINEITSAKANTPKDKQIVSTTPQTISREPKKEVKSGGEKWRSYTEEKQKRIYENTLFPHIKAIMDKFKGKLPKDDLKRFAKEISKKLVNSDYKNNRVQDPTKLSEKHQKQVKKYVKDFFDRAVEKNRERQKRKAEKKSKEPDACKSPNAGVEAVTTTEGVNSDEDKDVEMSDDDDDDDGERKVKIESDTPITPLDQLSVVEGLKRKRVGTDDINGSKEEDPESTPSKRLKSESPPPVPPPPSHAPPDGMFVDAEQAEYENALVGMDTDHESFASAMNALSKPPPPPDTEYPADVEKYDDDIASDAHEPHLESGEEDGDPEESSEISQVGPTRSNIVQT